MALFSALGDMFGDMAGLGAKAGKAGDAAKDATTAAKVAKTGASPAQAVLKDALGNIIQSGVQQVANGVQASPVPNATSGAITGIPNLPTPTGIPDIPIPDLKKPKVPRILHHHDPKSGKESSKAKPKKGEAQKAHGGKPGEHVPECKPKDEKPKPEGERSRPEPEPRKPELEGQKPESKEPKPKPKAPEVPHKSPFHHIGIRVKPKPAVVPDKLPLHIGIPMGIGPEIPEKSDPGLRVAPRTPSHPTKTPTSASRVKPELEHHIGTFITREMRR